MIETIFRKLEKEMLDAGIDRNSRDSMFWLSRNAQLLLGNLRGKKLFRADLVENEKQWTSVMPWKLNQWLGNMYMFYYMPEDAESLTTWDALPLVIPIERYPTYMVGFNIHYIHPKWRGRVLERLKTFRRQKGNYDEGTYHHLLWNTIKSLRHLRVLTHAIRRYNYSKVQSRFLRIPPRDWELAVWMPTEKFQKKRRFAVWTDYYRELINAKGV